VSRSSVVRSATAAPALHPVQGGVVDVQVRIVLAGVVLEERRDGPVVGVGPAAGGATVLPDPGVAGVLSHVGEHRVVARPDRVLDRSAALRPRRRGLLVPDSAGGDFLRLERGVHQRHRLLNVEREVVERHVLPRRLPRLNTQFSAAFSARARLLFKSGRVQLLLRKVLAAGVAESGHLTPALRVPEPRIARIEVALIERAHVLRVDQPGEAQVRRSGAPPPAGRLSFGDRAGVVVLAAGHDLLEQVLRAVARPDTQHHGDHPPIEMILNGIGARSTAWSAGSGRPEAGPHPRIGMPRCEALDLVALGSRS